VKMAEIPFIPCKTIHRMYNLVYFVINPLVRTFLQADGLGMLVSSAAECEVEAGKQPPPRKEEVQRIVTSRSTSEYYRLRGVLGYCLGPLSWEKVLELVNNGTPEALREFGWDPETVAKYWSYRKLVSPICHPASAPRHLAS
jgi:hypothetical protein